MPTAPGGRLRGLLAYLFLMPAALVVAGLIFYPLISVGNISLRLGRTMNWPASARCRSASATTAM